MLGVDGETVLTYWHSGPIPNQFRAKAGLRSVTGAFLCQEKQSVMGVAGPDVVITDSARRWAHLDFRDQDMRT